jgi:hypothetical protein
MTVPIVPHVRPVPDEMPGRLLVAAVLSMVAGLFTAGIWLLASSTADVSFRSDGPLVAALPAYVALTFVAALLLSGERRAVGLATAGLGLLVGLVVMPLGVVLLVLCGVAACLIGSVDRPGVGTPRSAWLALGGSVLGAGGLVAMDNDPLRPGDERTPEVAGVLLEANSGNSYTVRLADASERTLSGRAYGSADIGDLLLAGSAPTPWIVAIDHFAGFDPGRSRDGRYVGVADGLLGRQAGVGAPGARDEAVPATPALIGYFCLDTEGRVVSWNA